MIRSDPGANIDLTASYTANGLGRQWRKRMSDKAIAGPLMAMGMMGWDNPLWDGSTALIPNDAGFTSTTRGQAYSAFRQVFDYIGDDWHGTGGQDTNSWGLGQWGPSTTGYLRNDDDYNLYSIQWAAKGLSAVGAVCVGGTEARDAHGVCTDGNDWRHQHTVLLVRRQAVSATGARVVQRARLGVDRVDLVALDEDAADVPVRAA